jgi:putative FmdB family regulatory protein
MPTYEYVCAKCEHHFEMVQPITDPPLTVCPRELCPRKKWGKGKVTRAVSAGGGLLFKGSGFYETDYRSENYKAAAKKEAGATTGATDKKKESKAEAPKPKSESSTPPKSDG